MPFDSGTNIDEIADGIYRINTPFEVLGGFSFSQYLIVDDAPLLFHTGPRRLFGLVREAVASVLPPRDLRYIAFSHYEADECGSLNEWLALAPAAVAACSRIAAMTSVDDIALRPSQPLADRETLTLGRHTVRWLDTPHLPHGWETGYLMESATRTLFCGDLFTQGGFGQPPVIETDILESSEAFRQPLDYFSHTTQVRQLIEKLADENPTMLAVMHGSTAARGAATARVYCARWVSVSPLPKLARACLEQLRAIESDCTASFFLTAPKINSGVIEHRPHAQR